MGLPGQMSKFSPNQMKEIEILIVPRHGHLFKDF